MILYLECALLWMWLGLPPLPLIKCLLSLYYIDREENIIFKTSCYDKIFMFLDVTIPKILIAINVTSIFNWKIIEKCDNIGFKL